MAGIGRQANDGRGRMGGRQKGTPNKSTNELKTWIKDLLDESRDIILDDLSNVEPWQRLAFFERLIPYVLPKQTQIEANIDIENEYIPIPPDMTKDDGLRIIDEHLAKDRMTDEEKEAEIARLMKLY